MFSNQVKEEDYHLIDEMSDGQWHPMSKISKAVNEHQKTTLAKLKSKLEFYVEQDFLMAGQNNSFRMSNDNLVQWRNYRNLSLETKDSHSPRYFGGILEDDGWAYAPLKRYDLLNFRANSALSVMSIQDHIGDLGSVQQMEDGLFRIFAEDGAFVYDMLKAWSESETNININGLRLTKDAYRRDMQALPSAYFSDLCKFYGDFSFILLRKNMSSVKKHLPDTEDIQQQIYIWVMDAVTRYDPDTCIPFAAYLHNCLTKWVHNLNRQSHGRAAADNELKHSRAISTFEAENGRKPTIHELSEILDEPLDKVKKDSMSIKTLSNLRTATTLDSEDFDIPLVSEDRADSTFESRMEKTLLSAALINTAWEMHDESNGMSGAAFMSIVDKTWNKDKRLSSLYKSKRSTEMTNMEARVLSSVGAKLQDSN